jgi:hypothetical protein
MFSIYICEYCLHEYSCEGSPSGCPNCGGTSTLIARDDGPNGEMVDYTEPEILWCDEHQCEFDLTFRDPPGYEFYACPECERERGEALGLR